MEHPPEIPWEELATAVTRIVGGEVGDPVDLGGSSRSHVWRVRGNGAVPSFVVKASRGEDDGSFAREAAALEVLDGSGVTPHLVGLDEQRRLMVLEDLGAGTNLADRLLGDDPVAAARGLEQWAEAIARLHTAGPALTDRFVKRRDELRSGSIDGFGEAIDLAVDRYRADLPALGVEVDGVAEALRELVAGLSSTPVLSPTDACPDNNLEVGDRLVLIDFEGAQVQDPAWDVSYLRVPWASCWCAWALPADVTEAAVARYVELADPGPAFADDLAAVTLAWSVITPGWFLPRALRPEPGDSDDPRVPDRRGMIQHRLREAAAMEGPEVLTSFAAAALEALEREWGAVRLPLAPAFRQSRD